MAAQLTRATRLFLLLIILPLPGVAQESEAVLEVRVVESGTGEPVPGAIVRVEGTTLVRVTNDAGVTRVAGLGEGDHVVTATAPGFAVSESSQVSITGPGLVQVEIRLSEPTFDLPSLVVTANRGAARFGETSASVDVIESDYLERLSAITVDEGLRFASGVTFNARQLDIRGASGLARGVGSRVLVLVDGHRFLSGTTGGVTFQTIPSLGLERIEVVKGPSSTLYGSAALGGVVNVIRKPIGDRPQTSARAYMGVYDTPSDYDFTDQTLSYQGVDVRHARRIGPVGAFLEIGRRSSDGYRENDSFEQWIYHTGFSLPREEGPPKLELSIAGSLEDRFEHFEWQSPQAPLRVAEEALGDRVDEEQWSVAATVVPLASATTLLRLRPGAYVADVKNNFSDNDDYHRSVRYNLDSELTLSHWDRHVVTVGAEGAYTPVTSNILADPRAVDAALFVQDEFSLSGRLEASAGVRLDHHSVDPGSGETQINPRFGLVWKPGRTFTYRASIGRGYRAPSPIEQFVSTSQSGYDVIPNPDLGGESSWAVEVGAAGRLLEWAWLEAGLFESRFDDLIEPAQVPGQFFTFQFRNIQRARVRGLDLSTRIGLPEALLQGRINYLFLDARDLRREAPLPYRSKHNVTLSVDVGPLGLDMQHRSRVDAVLAFPLDPREAITLLDLRVGFRAMGLMGQVKVANLLQETYVDVQERNLGPSRSLQLTLFSGL